MEDLNKLLDGSIDDVKNGLAGRSHDDLLKLKAAEQGGKTRKGVLEALDAAIAAADAARAGGRTQDAAGTGADNGALTNGSAGGLGIAADLDNSGPANIAPADAIDTSGAPQQIVPGVDMSHPAIDDDPRAGTTEMQNRIDLNDPTKPGHQVVEEQLARRGA